MARAVEQFDLGNKKSVNKIIQCLGGLCCPLGGCDHGPQLLTPGADNLAYSGHAGSQLVNRVSHIARRSEISQHLIVWKHLIDQIAGRVDS